MFRVYRVLGTPQEVLEQLPDDLTTFSVPGEDLHRVVNNLSAIKYFISAKPIINVSFAFVRFGNNYAAIASSCGFPDWDASYLFVEFDY